MRKITIAFLLFGFTAGAANAAPSYIKRDDATGYNITYSYMDKEKNDWYMTIRAQLNMLSFENEYSATSANTTFGPGGDKYSMESVFGGTLSVGKKFGSFWRGELEAGYTGNFMDADNEAEFNFSSMSLMANAMYDFTSGIYLGAGIGAAYQTVSFDYPAFIQGDRKQSSLAPMGAIMLGYSKKLDDNFVLDLRYRLAGMSGNTYSRDFYSNVGVITFESKMGMILENSLSIGLRYEF